MSDPWNLNQARTREIPGLAGVIAKPIDFRKLFALAERYAGRRQPACSGQSTLSAAAEYAANFGLKVTSSSV